MTLRCILCRLPVCGWSQRGNSDRTHKRKWRVEDLDQSWAAFHQSLSREQLLDLCHWCPFKIDCRQAACRGCTSAMPGSDLPGSAKGRVCVCLKQASMKVLPGLSTASAKAAAKLPHTSRTVYHTYYMFHTRNSRN